MAAPQVGKQRTFNRDQFLQQLAAMQDQKAAQTHLQKGAPNLGLKDEQVRQIGSKDNGKEMAAAIQALLKASAPGGATGAGAAKGGAPSAGGAQGAQSCKGSGSGGSCNKSSGGCAGRGLNGCNGNTNCSPPNGSGTKPLTKPGMSSELKKQLQDFLDKGGETKNMPKELKDSLSKEGITVKEAEKALKTEKEGTGKTEDSAKNNAIGATSVTDTKNKVDATSAAPAGDVAPPAGSAPVAGPAPVESAPPPAAAPPAAAPAP